MPAKSSVTDKIKFLCNKHSIDIDINVLGSFLTSIDKSNGTQVSDFFLDFMIECHTYATKDIVEIIERYKLYKTYGRGVKLDKLCAKFGEVEGNFRWKNYCDKQAVTNTFEYKQKKYGMTKEEFDEYNSSRAVTYDNLINRHGIVKGTKIWDDYCSKQAKNGCTLEYFIEKLGEVEGTKKYEEVCSQKVLNLENFVRKYGETEGIIKFEIYLKNANGLDSYIANDMCYTLHDNLADEFKQHCYFNSLNYEKFIYTLKYTNRYDFCIENIKLIIEFNGDFFHANPITYKPDDLLEFKKLTAQEIWDKDAAKIKLAEDAGYKVIVVWESDYKSNKQKVISELLEIINNEPVKI